MIRLFLQQNFDVLKQQVLAAGGYDHVSPSDCKPLSIQIFRKTGHQLSDTTLKRVYGFAYSKFQPSLFTLDAMALFSGFSGWADFCEKNAGSRPEFAQKDVCWETLKKNAARITGFTLQVLRNRCGIPYRYTIKRKFLDDHFDAFLKDGYSATAIAGPAGYGKTISLCHWIEEKMAAVAEGSSNDIVLFTSSSALVNVFTGEKDIKEWLLSLLGYNNENDISILLDTTREQEGNFYLVVDGLDEHMFKPDQFSLIFNQVMDILSFYQGHKKFKLVLTMRSSTWINYRHEMAGEDDWFNGFLTDTECSINTPPFNAGEIKELCSRINPEAKNFVGLEIAANFSHPLYFQYYYKAHKSDFSFNHIDHVCIYEMISAFILNKIYLGPYAAEKVLLIRALAASMDFENEDYEVDRATLNDVVKQYNNAYNDLLAIGFIREVNRSTDAHYQIGIGFCNNKFLEYTVAFSFLFNNSNIFDGFLIDQINNLLKPGLKVQVLKWCLFYAIRNGQQQSFELLSTINLTVQEKSDVIIFMGEMLDKSRTQIAKTESKVQYFNRDCSDDLFDYFFGLEFISVDYISTLQTLLRFELSPRKKLMIYTGLAVIAAVQLDTARLENHLVSIKNFPSEDLQQLPVNPLNCLETIYYWLKYGILKKAALKELTAFYFNPPLQTIPKNNTNDVLFLLALFTIALCKNGMKTRRFLRAMHKVYESGPELSGGYNFIMALIKAENHFRLNETGNGNTAFAEIADVYVLNRNAFTPFMKTFYHLVMLEMALTKKEGHVQGVMKSLSFLAEEAALKIFKLEALSLTLANRYLLALDENYTRQLHYEFIRIIRENGLRAENFIDDYVPIVTNR